MRRRTTYINYAHIPSTKPVKRYGCFGFLGDVIMTIFTLGFWLIWVFVREMRRR